MTIYIGKVFNGQNGNMPVDAYRFANKYEFYLYCNELTAMRDSQVNKSMNIEQLCEAIHDLGSGIGIKYYMRINRATAEKCANIYF